MIRLILLFALSGSIAFPALAQQNSESFDQRLNAIFTSWARIKYETADGRQTKEFESLVQEAENLRSAHPERAEALVWEGIARASFAGSMSGLRSLFSALPQVKKARELLLAAEKIDSSVLDGSVYTSLGSLYYLVPGSPIGFGDRDQALAYLEKAIALAPEGIDPNFFLGDYWLEQGEVERARPYLLKALEAPDRPGRPLADKGRREEARRALAALDESA